MKKLLALTLSVSALTLPVFAQSNATTEEQIKQFLSQDVLSAQVDYSGDITLGKENGVYNALIPAGKLKQTNKIVPAFSFLMPEQGQLNGNTRYRITLDKLIQVMPELNEVLEKYKASYSTFKFTGDIVPALDLSEQERLEMTDLTIPLEENVNVTIKDVSLVQKSAINANGDGNSNFQFLAQGITGSHLFGNVTIQKWEIGASLPMAMRVSSYLEDITKVNTIKQHMTLSNVQFNSMFSKGSFDLKQTFDTSADEKNQLTAVLSLTADNVVISEQPDMPKSAKAILTFSGFTLEQVKKHLQAMEAYQQIAALPRNAQNNQALATAKAKADVASNALLKNMIMDVDASVDSDKYQVLIKGTMKMQSEQFNGTMTVVNFDYLAPQPKAVDQAACQRVMDKVLDGTLTGDNFQKAYEEHCSERKGPLDHLRPYATTAKRSTVNGKEALVFDLKYDGNQLFINAQPVQGI